MKLYFPAFFLALGYLTAPVSAANGTCIESPQSACTSLVAICISQVATGQIASNSFWSSPVCFAAATCSTTRPAAVLDAACCAGTCVTLANMNNLDYNTVYAPMVGSCAFATSGCPVTCSDYVNYFYFTIQQTATNNWPYSGDDVLQWWSEIATWNAFFCVNGQIPYLNLNDWLRFSSTTLVTSPGNPPIREPLSTDRDNNTDVWDPEFDGPCPFDNSTLCFASNGPQEPPDDTTASLVSASILQRSTKKLVGFPLKLKSGLTAESLPTTAKYLPPNIPPSVYISNGTGRVPVQLNFTAPPARREYSLVAKDTVHPPATLEKRPAIRSDVCKTTVDTPSPLPILTYYCDYLPDIYANIRASGLLSGDQVVLTYDAFNTGSRRRGLCTPAQKKEMQMAGGCDRTQHDPLFWKISCDEFPFNSVLEGGLANGARVVGVPIREQQLQGQLNSALQNLRRVQNDARTQWGRPGKISGQWAGQCHKYILQLEDTRPAGTAIDVIGTLYTGGAWLIDQPTGDTQTITDHRAAPPPVPRTPYDYPSDAIAVLPPGGYKSFDCRPCTIGSVNGVVPSADADAAFSGTNTTRVAALEVEAVAATTCTKTSATSTPTPSSDAQSNAGEAAAAAAAAVTALSSVNNLPAPTMSAVSSAVEAAQAAATGAAVAAAAAVANNPADMANAIGALAGTQAAVQSAISSITDIFGTGTIPAAIAGVISWASIVGSTTSSVIIDTWNTKPAATNPVPPDADPARDPNVNSGGGTNVAAAGCFRAGSSGKITINGPFTWDATGTATDTASIVDAGSAAYFGVNLGGVGDYHIEALCSGVYGWTSGTSPSYQVSCSSDEFGTYWNAAKQTCYTVPLDDGSYSLVCGTDIGSIYSCLQSNGYRTQITAVSFTWSS